MADSVEQLSEYKLQLQQVEAALTTDPDNAELNKLKKDLGEVILLTEELIASNVEEAVPSGSGGANYDSRGSDSPALQWAVGDRCMAVYPEDEQYYPALIDEVLPNGTCTVTFEGYGNTEVTQSVYINQQNLRMIFIVVANIPLACLHGLVHYAVTSIREFTFEEAHVSTLQAIEERSKREADDDNGPDAKKNMSKKDLLTAQREYKRKKNLKKAQRLKALEEEREVEKNKWLDFNAKTFSKSNKGRVKRSIFATPDAVQGRVGVGTCGVGGRPMTNYTHQEKWKKQ